MPCVGVLGSMLAFTGALDPGLCETHPVKGTRQRWHSSLGSQGTIVEKSGKRAVRNISFSPPLLGSQKFSSSRFPANSADASDW
jgi:hypothetical protein